MTTETTTQQLRRVVAEIRRKPYPIKDLIPLLDRAATELEKCYAKTIDDDEFARYLASYLVQRQEDFVACWDAFHINEGVLYQLIKQFRQELP